jgi:hypothetical protein
MPRREYRIDGKVHQLHGRKSIIGIAGIVATVMHEKQYKKLQKVVFFLKKPVDHLARATNTSRSRRRVPVLAPPSPDPGKLIVVELAIVDIRDVSVLRPQKTNALEQQPSSMMTTVDRKRLA